MKAVRQRMQGVAAMLITTLLQIRPGIVQRKQLLRFDSIMAMSLWPRFLAHPVLDNVTCKAAAAVRPLWTRSAQKCGALEWNKRVNVACGDPLPPWWIFLILVQSAADRSAAARPAATTYNRVNYDIRRHRITPIDGRQNGQIHSFLHSVIRWTLLLAQSLHTEMPSLENRKRVIRPSSHRCMASTAAATAFRQRFRINLNATRRLRRQ